MEPKSCMAIVNLQKKAGASKQPHESLFLFCVYRFLVASASAAFIAIESLSLHQSHCYRALITLIDRPFLAIPMYIIHSICKL